MRSRFGWIFVVAMLASSAACQTVVANQITVSVSAIKPPKTEIFQNTPRPAGKYPQKYRQQLASTVPRWMQKNTKPQ